MFVLLLVLSSIETLIKISLKISISQIALAPELTQALSGPIISFRSKEKTPAKKQPAGEPLAKKTKPIIRERKRGIRSKTRGGGKK
jgi:hypothetical protein